VFFRGRDRVVDSKTAYIGHRDAGRQWRKKLAGEIVKMPFGRIDA
jgi:hypothetical protein